MLGDPNGFISEYDEHGGIAKALKLLLLTCAAVFAPLAIIGAVFNLTSPLDIAAVFVVFGGLALVLWLLTLVEAAIAHVVVVLLGGSGLSRSLEAYAYPAIVRYGLWWLPVVNVGLGLYGWYLTVRSLGSFHGIGDGRGFLAALVAVMIINLPAIVLIAAVIWAFTADMGGGAGAPPPVV